MASSLTLKKFILGIDIGTTTVKVSLIDSETNKVLESAHNESKAGGEEQDPACILHALNSCLSSVSRDHLTKVSHICVCGQMHVCFLFWS